MLENATVLTGQFFDSFAVIDQHPADTASNPTEAHHHARVSGKGLVGTEVANEFSNLNVWYSATNRLGENIDKNDQKREKVSGDRSLRWK